MAKKVRKPRSQSPRTYAQASPAAPTSAAAPGKSGQSQAQSTTVSTSATKKATPVSTTKGAAVNWEAEYHYVYQDLRRTFILAGALLLLLIAVNVAFRLM